MSEALVKKMFKHDANINDLLEIEKYITPLHQGFMIPHGMASVPFFLSNPFFLSEPIGMNYDKKTGLFLTQNSIASYARKLNGKIDLNAKYLNGLNKDMVIHLNGSLNDVSKMIDGKITFRKGQDDYYGFYILPSFDNDMFYKFLNGNLHS